MCEPVNLRNLLIQQWAERHWLLKATPSHSKKTRKRPRHDSLHASRLRWTSASRCSFTLMRRLFAIFVSLDFCVGFCNDKPSAQKSRTTSAQTATNKTKYKTIQTFKKMTKTHAKKNRRYVFCVGYLFFCVVIDLNRATTMILKFAKDHHKQTNKMKQIWSNMWLTNRGP